MGWMGWIFVKGVIGLLRAPSVLITIQKKNDNTTNHFTQVHTMDKEPPPADPK